MVQVSIEVGQIIKTAGGRARVRLPRNDSCRACGLCLFGSDGSGMILEAENEVGAAAGDRVELEIPRRDPLFAALLLFGLPLLALLAGAGIGYALAGAGAAVLLAALFLAGAFLLIRHRELRRRKRAGERIRVLRVVARSSPSA